MAGVIKDAPYGANTDSFRWQVGIIAFMNDRLDIAHGYLGTIIVVFTKVNLMLLLNGWLISYIV